MRPGNTATDASGCSFTSIPISSIECQWCRQWRTCRRQSVQFCIGHVKMDFGYRHLPVTTIRSKVHWQLFVRMNEHIYSVRSLMMLARDFLRFYFKHEIFKDYSMFCSFVWMFYVYFTIDFIVLGIYYSPYTKFNLYSIQFCFYHSLFSHYVCSQREFQFCYFIIFFNSKFERNFDHTKPNTYIVHCALYMLHDDDGTFESSPKSTQKIFSMRVHSKFSFLILSSQFIGSHLLLCIIQWRFELNCPELTGLSLSRRISIFDRHALFLVKQLHQINNWKR